MNTKLLLLAGGPPSYQGLPKPLQLLPTGEPLLALYLRTICYESSQETIILHEDACSDQISRIAKHSTSSTNTSLFSCRDNTSTLQKLLLYLKTNTEESHLLISYPDIFLGGSLLLPSITDCRYSDSVFVSFIPVQPRFSRLLIDPYNQSIRGISLHKSPLPANPFHIYGGHIAANSTVLYRLLTIFISQSPHVSPSLEYDFFFWLINQSKLYSMAIDGSWHHADSSREILAIIEAFS